MSNSVLRPIRKKCLHHVYIMFTCNVYRFLSYNTGSNIHVNNVNIDSSHVLEKISHHDSVTPWDDFFMNRPLMKRKNVYTFQFSLGNSGKICKLWCKHSFWYIVTLPYVIAEKSVNIKCKHFLRGCKHFFKQGCEIS